MRVHPDKVLIKITKDEWRDLFSIWINRANGERVQLFTDVEESDGYERRFKQNLSVGTIVAPGANVSGVIKGDVAIIDYLVTGADDGLVLLVERVLVEVVHRQEVDHHELERVAGLGAVGQGVESVHCGASV